jgi:hypothetical protein
MTDDTFEEMGWRSIREMAACCRRCRRSQHLSCEMPMMVIDGKIEVCCCGQ